MYITIICCPKVFVDRQISSLFFIHSVRNTTVPAIIENGRCFVNKKDLVEAVKGKGYKHPHSADLIDLVNLQVIELNEDEYKITD